MIEPGTRVLDLGCGSGYGSREVARNERVRELLAVDSSHDALEIARRYYPDPKIRHERIDVESFGWEKGLGRYDAVIAFEVVEHLRREDQMWRGIGSVLAPGGDLWLSTPLGRGRGRPAADPHHVHQLRRSEVAELFARGWMTVYYGQVGGWIEPWMAGRRYYTILVRARRQDG